ncbi:MAG: peptide ABC transporter permease, partial [Thiomonas sp. 13-66-29]
EPVVGYAKQWLWNPVGKLKFGAGYTAGITSRADIFENIPFPIALPLLSVGYGRFTIYGTFIPRINSTLNNGNVAFFFAGYAFQ